jgi:hypothetical protein
MENVRRPEPAIQSVQTGKDRKGGPQNNVRGIPVFWRQDQGRKGFANPKERNVLQTVAGGCASRQGHGAQFPTRIVFQR